MSSHTMAIVLRVLNASRILNLFRLLGFLCVFDSLTCSRFRRTISCTGLLQVAGSTAGRGSLFADLQCIVQQGDYTECSLNSLFCKANLTSASASWSLSLGVSASWPRHFGTEKALPFASFQIFYKYFQSFNVFPSSVNDLSIFSFEAPWRHGLTPKKMVNTWTSLISALAGQLGPLFHHLSPPCPSRPVWGTGTIRTRCLLKRHL